MISYSNMRCPVMHTREKNIGGNYKLVIHYMLLSSLCTTDKPSTEVQKAKLFRDNRECFIAKLSKGFAISPSD